MAVLCGVCEKEPATRECLNCAKPGKDSLSDHLFVIFLFLLLLFLFLIIFVEVLPLCLDCSAPIHKGRMMSSHTVNLLGASPRKPHVERYLKEKNKGREVKRRNGDNDFNNSHNIIRCTTHRKKKTLFCMDDTSLVCGHCMVCFERTKGKEGKREGEIQEVIKIIYSWITIRDTMLYL